ncbi:Uncharacterized protein BM_BM7309 [Brugia malayi]|uniref:DNA repair and recombination protein RAD54-like n=1 Tax=Brugia malayi TaxID=6279 RepID=A0A4E9EUK1_BRUMA|nr:Uncharacterized protein BM_BM7309 [Brugia malayi]VIO87763.1 Uncharacterized protein BM_BM7309 [Brugia malayi]
MPDDDDDADTMVSQDEEIHCCYEVLYGKISSRRHKRWQGDGLLYCRKRSTILLTEDGEEVARTSGYSFKQLRELKVGSQLKVSNYEVEVQNEPNPQKLAEFGKQPIVAELAGSSAAHGESSKKKRRITDQIFISPLFGRDNPLDLVLDETKDDDGFVRRIAVDVQIARHLRPHQKDGVAFMYRCLKLFRILKSTDVKKLISYRNTSMIAIVSYEMIARTAAKLSVVSVDLLVCDEAHRIKNLNGRLREQLQILHAQRRLLLTGTPMQNDLEEFYSLVNFARPDLFISFLEFKNLCEMESTRFNELLSEVMLRRTAEVIHDLLPPKIDYIVWCRPSALQCSIYKNLKKFLPYDHLTLIDALRKLCNHPFLLYQSMVVKRQTCKVEEREFYNAFLQSFPNTFNAFSLSTTDSGKLNVFVELLATFREQEEKVVIVSNFTQTLDLLEELCRTLYYTILRLDGSTEAKKRMEIVEEFNSLSNKNYAFLLSAKAGGLGLNLVGANRMILFDSDWNPAVDMQAMARIWRQGQEKPCHIFRLITAGTVDEKILQRQIKKSSLNTIVEMVPVESLTHFSDEELQDVFTLRDDAECETHFLLECQCDGRGFLPEELEVDQEISSDENSAFYPDVEHVTTYSEGMDENYDHTSVAEDSLQPSLNSLMQNCIDTIHFASTTNEVHEDDAGNKILGDEAALSSSALMGTLMRWQHHSPKHDQFESLKAEADLEECCLDEVSFIMKLVSNF